MRQPRRARPCAPMPAALALAAADAAPSSLLTSRASTLIVRALQLSERTMCCRCSTSARCTTRGAAFSMFDAASGWQRWLFMRAGVGGQRRADRLAVAPGARAGADRRPRWR